MEPFPVDVLGGFHYFVVRLLEIVSEPGAIVSMKQVLRTASLDIMDCILYISKENLGRKF